MILESQIAHFFDHHTSDAPPSLREAIQYSLTAPGKRIRPRLLLAGAQSVELSQSLVFPAAVALEMVHCFTLIHDDLPCMDNADTRRGRPSNHKVYGEAMALLAGDALLNLAFQTFQTLQDRVPQAAFMEAFQIFSRSIGTSGVIGGQALEADLLRKPDIQGLLKMHALKTGALFEASLNIPRAFAEISPSSEKGEAIRFFAQALGFAFQIADDLEDAEEDQNSPLTILHYLKPEEAKTRALDPLRASQAMMERNFGKESDSLIQISEEVTDRIKNIKV